jgi:hypothetical protein
VQALKRFLHLSKQERSLLLKAALATIVVRLSLALLSLPTVQHLAVNLSWGNGESLNPTRIVWAMRAVARLVPGSTCLVQALAAQALLIRYGYRPLVTIGVTKDECDRFGAHAWVTCENQVLIGGQYVENYTALLNLGS